jgi:hypothetical protein
MTKRRSTTACGVIRPGLKLALALSLSLGLLTLAAAQTSAVSRNVKAMSGRDIRLTIFANVRPDCTSGPLPTIRLVIPPEHGRIVVKRGRLNATNIKNCLAVEVPALVAFYRSAADFEGNDSAILEIKTASGAQQLQRFTIKVDKAGGDQKI